MTAAVAKCPAKRLVMVGGKPSPRDLEATADKKAPAVIEPDFHTTVDETEYRG